MIELEHTYWRLQGDCEKSS